MIIKIKRKFNFSPLWLVFFMLTIFIIEYVINVGFPIRASDNPIAYFAEFFVILFSIGWIYLFCKFLETRPRYIWALTGWVLTNVLTVTVWILGLCVGGVARGGGMKVVINKVFLGDFDMMFYSLKREFTFLHSIFLLLLVSFFVFLRKRRILHDSVGPDKPID